MSALPHMIHNGRPILADAATLPVYTPAFLGALGVYETILALRGRIVALDEHLARLYTSAEGAQLRLSAKPAALTEWCQALVAANAPDGLIRILVFDLGQPTADVYLYQMPYEAPPPDEYETGVAVAIYHGERTLPLVKSFNTLVPGLARKAADAVGAHDALLVDRNGLITEGSNCNVFAIIDGELVTPPYGTVLEGTVMARTIALARELGIPFARRSLPLADVPKWDEAFLTSTRRRILPINRVGEHALGRPGPCTQQLMRAYWAWESAI